MMTYDELSKIQFQEYPTSVLVSWKTFKEFHKGNSDNLKIINWYERNAPNAVCYYLKNELSYGGHYNGIRFGLAGDYCSFSHINPI